MKIATKLAAFTTVLVSTVAKATAHTGENQNYGSGMMWSDGSWMHNGWHMAGYNMWGLGWLGVLFGIAFWVLVILGIIYLYQQITEGSNKDETAE